MATLPALTVHELTPTWLVVELDTPLVELHLVLVDGTACASWVNENGLELVRVEVAEA